MTILSEEPILVPQFEAIARAVEREADGVQVELIDGRMGVKPVPDGDHNGILNWLMLFFAPFVPRFFLHPGQGLAVGAYRKGRARPDGVVAPLKAFRHTGEWASPEQVVMAVEVTSYDSDTNRRDRIEKPAAYAQSGIPIYLLIDRDNAEIVVYSEPVDGRYCNLHRCRIGREVKLPDPIGLTMDTAPLLEWLE